MHLSTRALAVEPFYAMQIAQEADALDAAGARVVRLCLGEPDFGAPPAVRAAMRQAMDGRPLPYTAAAGLPALRQALAGFYRQRHGVLLDPGRIVVTSGASVALLLVLAATIDPGVGVAMADPSYPCNRQMVAGFGGHVVSVPAGPATRFQVDRASLAQAWTPATRAVMLASPSNPTGTSIAPGEIAAICALARERGAWPIVDEIYLNLSDPLEDGSPRGSVLGLDPDAVVINSFSKYWGMTGWRLGWCVVPEDLVVPVQRLAMNYFLCASAPAQVAALAALTPESLAVCEQRNRELLARRALVLAGLAEIGLPVPVRPDGAFYVYVDVSGTGLGSEEFCRRALHEAHVALTPGRDFGSATADTHLRLSYAASQDALREGLDRLGTFVAGLPGA